MIYAILINAVIALVTLVITFKAAKRYFTTLSNIFSALASLVLMVVEIVILSRDGSMADLPMWAVLLKYTATVSVTVTFLTVMAFLGPIYTYKSQLSGSGAWVHLAGPVLAVIAFGLLEKGMKLSFLQACLGMLPTLLYGVVYLYQVVARGQEKGGWEDFYSFNRGGKWPIAFSAMVLGTALICVLLTLLHNA